MSRIHQGATLARSPPRLPEMRQPVEASPCHRSHRLCLRSLWESNLSAGGDHLREEQDAAQKMVLRDLPDGFDRLHDYGKTAATGNRCHLQNSMAPVSKHPAIDGLGKPSRGEFRVATRRNVKKRRPHGSSGSVLERETVEQKLVEVKISRLFGRGFRFRPGGFLQNRGECISR